MQVTTELTDKLSERRAALSEDMALLFDVAYALRSVPLDETTRWLEGQHCLGSRQQNPHPEQIRFLGLTADGLEKEYEVLAPSGERYRLAVTAESESRVQNNQVKIKYRKSYQEGPNPDIGALVNSQNHEALYLLPLIANLPLEDVQYIDVLLFLDKHNGFRIEDRGIDHARFWDRYTHTRTEVSQAQPLKTEVVKGCPARYKAKKIVNDTVNVYVDVERINGRVDLELEIEIPKKDLARNS